MHKITKNQWIGIVVAVAVVALFVTGFSSYLFPASAPADASTDALSAAAAADGAAVASTTDQTTGTAPATAATVAATAAGASASNSANPYASLPTPTAGQVLIHDLVVGTGTEAVAGKTVTVDYVGSLQNGTTFDTSASHGQPFSFTLGAGSVIKGWDDGVVGMKVGGVRLLVIPPDLGYGAQANGPIPANSVLIFQVRLDSVQ